MAVCFTFEGTKYPSVHGLPSSAPLAKALALVMRTERFAGKRRECLLWHTAGRFPAARYLVVGLGHRGEISADLLREGCGVAARRALLVKAKRLAVALPAIDDGPTLSGPAAEALAVERLAEAAADGLALGAYRLSKYQTRDLAGDDRIASAELVAPRAAVKDAQRGARRSSLSAEATNLVRDLVNEPAQTVTPMIMADVARRIARERGLAIRVYQRKDLERMGMGAILGVAAGSHQPPCLIHMIYRPAVRSAKGAKGARVRPRRVALVGKGLTFDSGGLSLKTASGMETMKLDKAGATVVLGVMSVLPALAPPVEVHGIMGMTENMPGGAAIKPGDVLRTMSGKTIEVLNTDAEGRLVLADALEFAQRQRPDEIIDLATLTGACMVALGPSAAGAFGTDQGMMDRLMESARLAGERMWQLPLYEEYGDMIRSDIADVKNSPSSRYGGAITAALFLKHFVGNGVPWIHLDIAGPAFLETEQGFMRKGATGATVRTLIKYLVSLPGSRPAH